MKRRFVALLFPLLGGSGSAVNVERPADQIPPPRGADTLVLDNISIVDVESGDLLPARRVIIGKNKILAIGDPKSLPKPKSAISIDGRGKFLIPGLWDMHTHSNYDHDRFVTLLIANGITGIRDAASELPLDSVVAWRRETLEGKRIAPPRQVLSGHSIDYKRCRRTVALHTCVADSADAVHVIDSLKSLGADMLKTYALTDKMYFVVAGIARRAGLPFGGHTMVPAIAASDSGAVFIDHSTVNGDLREACLYHNATVERCSPIAKKFQENGTWWVPTWIFPPRIAGGDRSHSIYRFFDRFITDFFDPKIPLRSLHDDLYRGYLNTDSVRRPRSLLPPPPTGSDVDSLGYMYVVVKAGLPVVAGTDTHGNDLVAGFSLHAEIATYVAEGMTPLQALQTATINPARALHATDSLGSVQPGKLADLVILDANPLEQITNTAAIFGVIANGRYLDRQHLDSLLISVKMRR